MRMNLANLIDSAEGMENWKSLAKLLKVEYLIDEANKSTGSPTLCILDMYEVGTVLCGNGFTMLKTI